MTDCHINWEQVGFYSNLLKLKNFISSSREWAIAFLYCRQRQQITVTAQDRPIDEKQLRRILELYIRLGMVEKTKRINNKGKVCVYLRKHSELWDDIILYDAAKKWLPTLI